MKSLKQQFFRFRPWHVGLVGLLGVLATVSILSKADTSGRDMSIHSIRAVQAVATVNGQPVSREVLDVLLRSRTENTNPYDEPGSVVKAADQERISADDKAKLISDLVLTELMAQKAIEKGIDKRPDFRAESELLWKTLLQQQLVRELIKEINIEEAELKSRYERLPVESLYHVKHVLVTDKALALQVIERLEQGHPISSLASRYSKDPSSRKDGDMGWLMLNQMMSAFAGAVQMLRPGEITREPVQTPAGWHVVQLVATKPLPKAAYTDMRGSLRQQVLVEKVNEKVAQLSKSATIKLVAK